MEGAGPRFLHKMNPKRSLRRRMRKTLAVAKGRAASQSLTNLHQAHHHQATATMTPNPLGVAEVVAVVEGAAEAAVVELVLGARQKKLPPRPRRLRKSSFQKPLKRRRSFPSSSEWCGLSSRLHQSSPNSHSASSGDVKPKLRTTPKSACWSRSSALLHLKWRLWMPK